MSYTAPIIPVYTEEESFSNQKFEDFQINSYQDTEPEHLQRIEPHAHTYFEIIWVLEGRGIHTIDFQDYSFCGPCLFLLSPRNIHTIRKDYPTKGGVLKFSSSFFTNADGQEMALLTNNVFDDTDVLPVLPLQEGGNGLIDEAFTELLKAYHNEGPFDKAIISAYLKILLYKIYTLKKHPVLPVTFSNADLEQFRSFQLLVEEGFISHHSVAHYADMLHLSTKSLANLTLKFTRKPPQQLIQERLVLQAKRYLYHSGLSVKEIAARLGFADQAYFNRFFKRNISLAPNQFRQRQRAE